MFKVQRFIFNGKSKYTWILMIHWYFEYSSLYDIYVFSFALSMWYRGASVTLCVRKIRNSWCSCPCCSRHFKITWRTWDPTIIMSTRWSCHRARLHQNTHAPPGKATPQHKSRERSSANTELTKLIVVFKHQWTNAARCQKGRPQTLNWPSSLSFSNISEQMPHGVREGGGGGKD